MPAPYGAGPVGDGPSYAEAHHGVGHPVVETGGATGPAMPSSCRVGSTTGIMGGELRRKCLLSTDSICYIRLRHNMLWLQFARDQVDLGRSSKCLYACTFSCPMHCLAQLQDQKSKLCVILYD